MANSDTILAIVDNIQIVTQAALGIKFRKESYEDDAKIPASFLPLGQITFEGLIPEYDNGQKPGYSEANILLRVVLTERASQDVQRQQIKWVSDLRDALTVNALNIGALATSKLVSWVVVEDIDPDNSAKRAVFNFEIFIRYREV